MTKEEYFLSTIKNIILLIVGSYITIWAKTNPEFFAGIVIIIYSTYSTIEDMGKGAI